MRTNVLNDLSNVVKKGAGLACSWSQVGRMSAEYPGNHPVITQLSPRNHPLLDAIWKHVAMIFAVLVMSVANVGMAWGKTWNVSLSGSGVSQDGITLTGDYAANASVGSSSKKANSFNTNYSSAYIFSEQKNITAISFTICRNTNGNTANNAVTVATSTGGAFAVQTSNFTATNNGSSISSLTNIQAVGNNQATQNTIVIAFAAGYPVQAVELRKASASLIFDISVTYEDETLPSSIFNATISGSTPAATVTPAGTSLTLSVNSSSPKTIGSDKYYQWNGDNVISLGSGKFQAGDIIIADVCGSGNNKAAGFKVNGGSTEYIVTFSASSHGQVFYTVSAGDGVAGQSSVTLKRKSSDTYVHAFRVLRAAGSCAATANAGADKSTTVGVGVAMAATAASSGYTGAWSIKAGSPSTATSQLGTTSSNTMTFTPNTYGTYTLVWTVTDNEDGSCSATDEATVTVPAPTHSITYTNLKDADNSANPSTYTEGVGVASFANLRHLVGYDFTGWSPSSISSSATTDQTIDAQWTARAAAAGTGTLTYALAFESSIITTSSITRNNGALYDATNISTANTSFVSGGEAPGNGCSGKLATTSSKDGSNYVELTFKIADGYTFTPSGVSIRANAVSNNKTLEVELKDNAASPHTKSVTATLEAGSTSGGVTYNLDFSSSPVTLEGTVTLKIYVYGSEGATKGWRIGPSVIVNGTVASAAVCPSAYSFHYGPAVGDWETPICFEQVGSTHEWNITNFAIPDHTNGQFWVGYAGETNSQSATKAWTDSYSDGNGAMKLLPTSSSIVGQATGATGTIRIWDNSGWKNQDVGFIPDGYGITYGGTGYAFSTTATDHMLETDVVTLPNVSSTTYTMGLATATAGTYVTCTHSKAAENINAMGVTNIDGGKKKILFNPSIGGGEGYAASSAKLGLYDITNSAWDTDFMTDPDGDGIYEGHVASNCTQIIIARFNSAKASIGDWTDKWNQTNDYTIPSDGGLLHIYKIDSWCSGENCKETISSTPTAAAPITGQKGKFRMWDNSGSSNWYVHFIPYYVLSYDDNGGSGTTTATERNSESSTLTVSVAANGFTAPTGYQFDHWDTATDGSGTDYAPGATYNLTADATLYAIWTPIPVSSITVSPSSKTLDVDGTQQLSVEVLPATALDKAVTWSTSNGSVATVSSTGLVTAKAPGSCTITATAHDGSGVTGTCSITVSKIQPTKYSFSVDKTTLCGGETATLTLAGSQSGVTYELREDSSTPIAETQKTGTGSALTWTGLGAGTYVVYAVADATYTERQMDGSKITISTGTATSITTQPTNQEVTVGEEATLTVVAAGTSLSYQWKESATEDGTYSNVASSGTSASYSVTPAAAGTKWYKCVVTGTCGEVTTEARKIVANAAVTYRVTYDAQGGSVTPAYEDVTTATLPTPTKTDYTFQGWYTSGGTLISGTYNPTADITLHALWREDECSGGGGGGSTTLISITPTITNDNKSNGSASASGTPGGTAYWDKMGTSSPYKLNSDKAYFALKLSSGYYQATDVLVINGADKAHYVYYGSHGSGTALSATGNPSSGTINFTLTGLPSSVDEIYVYRSSDSYNGKLSSMSVTRAGGGGTCYYVTYNGNGADGGFTKDEASHASGSNVTVANNSFTKTGYTFTGWHTDPDGEDGTAYIAGGTISGISGNMTLYAQWEEEVACSTDPTVTEGSNSSVTSTTATVSCTGGISSLGTGGCTITSYGFVLGTSANPTLSNTVHEVGTTYTTTGTSFSKDLTGLTASTTYYVRPYATNGNGTAYGTQTSFTTTAAPTTYTVTFNSNGGSSVSPIEQASEGASVALANPTRAGFEFDGWYKTDGTKVSSPYTPTADITLYARWQEACDAGGVAKSTTDVVATGYTAYQEKGGSNVVFTSAPSIGFKYKDADGNTINNSTTAVVRNNAYKCQISSDSGNKGSIKTNSTFSNVDSISFYFAASDKGGCKIAVWCSTDDFSTDSTQLLSATNYADNNSEFKLKTLAIPSGQKASALRFKFRFTVTSSGKTSYIDSLKIYSSTASSGTCYHVYYHGNGAESGYVNDTVSYTAGSKATVLNYNYGRYPLAKAGNDFQGWATSAGSAVAYTAGQKIDITSADVDLYAVWATASTALVTWTMNLNTSTWGAASTSTTDETNISSIGTARTGGSDGKREGATAKVSMAEKEVSSAAAPSNSANFTFTIAGGKQVEINKFDCKVFNVASGSRTYKAQISDGAGNVYNSTNTVAVSAEATLTDASFVFSSGKILRGDVTIRIYAWGSGSEFRMGPDIKFYGTVEDYECATPAAPTISGVSEYVPGQTITLTASHDGENHDNLTTYTWYKGVDWATASVTTPVQAAATGESGYTLTIDDCTTGDAGLYWCKVSNGTGCDAHNSEGYDVTVYPTYTITYNLNGGDWGEVEHKDSYTQFDEDYTLPTPTKTGFVFAGWYGASDFSGLPISLIETNSIGDKSFYAKWGSAVTATWTITKVDDKLYRGGGGYSVKAVIDQTAWNESYKDQLELTATEGVTLKNIVASVVSSHVQVTADFDITTGLAADATEITFTLDVPADGTYAPAELTHDEDLTSCAGSSTVWDFTTNDFLNGGTWSTSGGAENKAYATDGTTILKYYAGGSSDEWDSSNEQLKTQGATAFSTGTGKKQMTQKYFFFPTLSGKGTISVVYGTTSNDLKIYEATSNNIYGLEPIITLTSTSTTSTSYTFDGDKKYYMNMESNKVYFKRITFTASSGGITPTLSWTPALNTDADWDSGNNRLNKETGDVDFTFVAVQDKNSLGAITYSSSSPSVATVNAAGTVHIVGAAGDATITATLAASGCFEEATATYNIHVEDNCIDEPGTIAWTDLGCRGIQMTVSGHTALAGVSYQWYKVGTPDEAISGATEATYTATEAGEYYVVVTNTGTDHCPMASTNTVKVASKAAATATKIVDSWYVKNGRRTPDVALVQTTGATDFIVKNGETTIWNSDSTTTTGFGGCGFHMGTDGIIYLNGTKDNGDATTDLTAGDVTLKITANDGCGSSASELSITIHCQEATTYKEIAFVVDGEKGKGFDQVTSGHADGTELYEYLDTVGTAAGKSLFRLTEQNIYSTTDEKAIRQHYSQYDAILITDDPSTNKVPNKEDYKTGGYVNAFGTMVDVRPIFTMEAYVSALKNWGSKGIAGNPQSPNPRQYEMRLECKDHEIYGAGLPDPEDGTNVWEETIGGETFRHVILVDSTKGVYKGVAYNAETLGKEKPALQGFTGEAAGSLLGLGRILEGTLQAAIERQEEPAARLLVMGINAKALQPTCALTNEGKAVIKNILIYLLKTNMEEVDDCSNYFTGKNSTSWSDPGNWSKESLPSTEAKVRILAPCVISGIQPHVLQVSIVNSGNSNIRNTARGSAVCNGTLTIEPDGALIADGKIRSAVAPHFAANDLMPTTPDMLTINTNGSGQAALIFNNEEGLTKATVNLHSLGRNDGSYKYQYFAIPMEYVSVSPAFANETHGGTKIYTYVYNEASSGWTRRGYYDDLYAFEGLGITTKSTVAMNYTMTGTLASTATKEITLTHDDAGLNLIGNSWMAPIQIGALAEDNTDANITKTVYIYCAGRDAEGGAQIGDVSTEPAGQWIPIPFEASGTADWRDAGKLSVIPAMQAFQIKTAAEATLTLDYDKVVRGSTNDLNAKLRAPRRRVAAKEVTMTNIRVSDSKTHTDISLFEGERFSDEFDNGWEAEYMNGDGRSAKLYAETVDGKMAVVAMTDYEGTMVGFAPGQERVYIFSFMGADNGYYLNDIKMQQSVRISEGETYSFTYEDGDDASRFMISRTPFEKPGVATGTENIDASVPQARKILYNDKLYIIRGGHMYDATGKMVK